MGTLGIPRSDSFCAANITRNSWEPRPENTPYNQPTSDPSPYDSWWNSFPAWLALRAKVTGNFVGTTTEIFSFAACKWGIDEDTLRAVAVQESDWRERFRGDTCGPFEQASMGIMQVKNRNCSNEGDWGGYPATYDSTTYNVDFYAAALRGCMNGDFWYPYSIGNPDTLFWGCVGAWFSGSWNPTQAYVQSVQSHLANKDWLDY